jgi:putative hemolysin
MSLNNKTEIAKVTKLDKLGLRALANPIMDILRLNDLNAIYHKFAALHGAEFIDAVLKEFQLEFEYYAHELKRIPKEGPFVTVSNHPLGAIDAIILIKLISQVRPDYKVMASELLQKLEPLKDYLTTVDNLKTSFTGLEESLTHIEQGKPLGIFPAGKVSTYDFEARKIVDSKWSAEMFQTLKALEVPIVPIYIKARNSRFFYLLASVHPTFSEAKLPSEVLQQKGKSIRLRIGRSIPVKEQQEYISIAHYGAFLRQRTYLLRDAMVPQRKLFSLKRPKTPMPIVPAESVEQMEAELKVLTQKDQLLFEQKQYSVYLATAADIPHLLSEIGRLREITFRAVGEGTNKSLDLDTYDYHYHHLILWSTEDRMLAGAYRVGLGDLIFKRFGRAGFYTSTLFRTDAYMDVVFSKSLEMGRAFIVKDQQQKPMPLFLLWKGIRAVVNQNPQLEYITGCASISASFSKFSRSLMVEFLLQKHGDTEMAKHIKARKSFKSKLKEEQREALYQLSGGDISKFDRLIEEWDPSGMRMPVLIKKYLKQNARIVCFNVDPMFNNSLDGFMYIKTSDLPEAMER